MIVRGLQVTPTGTVAPCPTIPKVARIEATDGVLADCTLWQH